jgi:hypothetical protein
LAAFDHLLDKVDWLVNFLLCKYMFIANVLFPCTFF